MAHYKVGKRYLDDEEYDAHVIEIWGVSFFNWCICYRLHDERYCARSMG